MWLCLETQFLFQCFVNRCIRYEIEETIFIQKQNPVGSVGNSFHLTVESGDKYTVIVVAYTTEVLFVNKLKKNEYKLSLSPT